MFVTVYTVRGLNLEFEVGETRDFGELATVLYPSLFDDLFAVLLPGGNIGCVVVLEIVTNSQVAGNVADFGGGGGGTTIRVHERKLGFGDSLGGSCSGFDNRCGCGGTKNDATFGSGRSGGRGRGARGGGTRGGGSGRDDFESCTAGGGRGGGSRDESAGAQDQDADHADNEECD